MNELWQAHLTLALLAFVLLPAVGRSPGSRGLVLLGLLLLSYVPVAGLPLAAYPRSFTDDPAITSTVVLLWAALVRLQAVPRVEDRHRSQVILLFAALGLILYPATLGLAPFDPYRLAYSPRPLIAVAGAIALLMLYWRNWLALLMLTLATLAFSLRLKSSENYWDYLLDPFIVLYCWAALLAYGWKGLRSLRRTPAAARP